MFSFFHLSSSIQKLPMFSYSRTRNEQETDRLGTKKKKKRIRFGGPGKHPLSVFPQQRRKEKGRQVSRTLLSTILIFSLPLVSLGFSKNCVVQINKQTTRVSLLVLGLSHEVPSSCIRPATVRIYSGFTTELVVCYWINSPRNV